MTSIQGVFVGEMAGSVLDSGGGRDELKTQFMTREGTYHLMTLAGSLNIPCYFEAKFNSIIPEYSRPNRVGYANQAASCNAPVKVSHSSMHCQGLPQFGVFRFFP